MNLGRYLIISIHSVAIQGDSAYDSKEVAEIKETKLCANKSTFKEWLSSKPAKAFKEDPLLWEILKILKEKLAWCPWSLLLRMETLSSTGSFLVLAQSVVRLSHKAKVVDSILVGGSRMTI